MKKIYTLFSFFALISFTAFTQTAEIIEGFEDYPCDTRVYQETGWWSGWDCGGACAIWVDCSIAHSGTHSGLVTPYVSDDDYVDAILSMGNKIFGQWILGFWMYVPAGKEAYFNLQGITPVDTGNWIIGNIFFNKDGANPGDAYIDWSTSDTSDDTHFTYPEDQWFRVIFNFDITTGINAATFAMYIDDNQVVDPGTPLADGNGTYPPGLGGMEFFSISANNTYYIDDIFFGDPDSGDPFPSGTADALTAKGFEYYPNPVQDELVIKAKQNIDAVNITDVLGQTVYYAKNLNTFNTIDTSHLKSGMYFVSVQIGDSEGTVKIMK